MRQWNKVKASLDAHPDDRLVIDGYPTQQENQLILMATNCVSVAMQRAQKEQQRMGAGTSRMQRTKRRGMHDEPESNTIHAAIYARVSTDDQVQGTSLESQVEACHAYARSHGLVVWQSHVFVDGGVSGTLLERPALDAMREVVRTRAVQAIIVYALDRLSRVLWHQSMLIDEWKKLGCTFIPCARRLRRPQKVSSCVRSWGRLRSGSVRRSATA